jgi:hypothetical protein
MMRINFLIPFIKNKKLMSIYDEKDKEKEN